VTRTTRTKKFTTDLETLGLRHRRGHDLRRTLITLALTDGADKWKLELCTHTPRKKDRAIDLYNSQPWESLCAEIAKLKVTLSGPIAEARYRSRYSRL
jgi:hypothetical protein